jgi:hypothetical protein
MKNYTGSLRIKSIGVYLSTRGYRASKCALKIGVREESMVYENQKSVETTVLREENFMVTSPQPKEVRLQPSVDDYWNENRRVSEKSKLACTC